MADPQIEMQRQTRAQEGLALTWGPVPGAIRYGFVVGFADLPVPPLSAIMKGATRDFAVMGIPARFTGAVDLGSPVGQERQYGLVAYRGDGSIVSVPNVRYTGARSAPRDREYHSLIPPELVRSRPVASPVPVAPAPPEQQRATPPAQQPAVAASPPPVAPVSDPWSVLDEIAQREERPVTPAVSAPPASPAPPPSDPWDVLTAPVRDEPVDEPAPTAPVAASSALPEPAAPVLAAAEPSAPAFQPVQPVDPWDILSAPPREEVIADAREEPAALSTAGTVSTTEPAATTQPVAAAEPDPWDVLTNLSAQQDTYEPAAPEPAASIDTAPAAVPDLSISTVQVDRAIPPRPASPDAAPSVAPPRPAAEEDEAIVQPGPAAATAATQPIIDAVAVEPAVTMAQPEAVAAADMAEAVVAADAQPGLIATTAAPETARVAIPATPEPEPVTEASRVAASGQQDAAVDRVDIDVRVETPRPVVADLAPRATTPPNIQGVQPNLDLAPAPPGGELAEITPAAIVEDRAGASQASPVNVPPARDEVVAPGWETTAGTPAPSTLPADLSRTIDEVMDAAAPSTEADDATPVAEAVVPWEGVVPAETQRVDATSAPSTAPGLSAGESDQQTREPLAASQVAPTMTSRLDDARGERVIDGIDTALDELAQAPVPAVTGASDQDGSAIRRPDEETDRGGESREPLVSKAAPESDPWALLAEIHEPTGATGVEETPAPTIPAPVVAGPAVTTAEDAPPATVAEDAPPATAPAQGEEDVAEAPSTPTGVYNDDVAGTLAAETVAAPAVAEVVEESAHAWEWELPASTWHDDEPVADEAVERAVMGEPERDSREETVAVSPPTEFAAPEAVAGAPAEAAGPLTPQASASLSELLDEAEVYLLPSWLNIEEATRLLNEASALAPSDPRVRDLQEQLREAQ